MTAQPSLWLPRLAVYRQADNGRALIEICVTVAPFLGLCALMAIAGQVSLWLAPLLAIPAAGLLVRLFMIQHDCGHGAMFSSRRANDWVGRALGVVTLTPYDFWRQGHAMHHAGSGNLDRRGIGDIDLLTVAEYRQLSRLGKLRYRIYRHPLVMFGLGPAYLFVFRHRLPFGAMASGAMPWLSTMLTNAGIAGLVLSLVLLLGFEGFLVLYLPVVLIGASIGVWLFYVQHQFERTSWEHEPNWQHASAALHGSSYYDLPRPLMWLTANIGIHHLHHLCSRIPFYRLPQVLSDYPELGKIGRITLWQSCKCVRLTLWDEEQKRLVPFAGAALRNRPGD